METIPTDRELKRQEQMIAEAKTQSKSPREKRRSP